MAHVPDPTGLVFRRSSFSGGGNCVEVGAHGDHVYVRNSRHPDRPISVTAGSWAAFVEWVKNGRPVAATPATPGSA